MWHPKHQQAKETSIASTTTPKTRAYDGERTHMCSQRDYLPATYDSRACRKTFKEKARVIPPELRRTLFSKSPNSVPSHASVLNSSRQGCLRRYVRCFFPGFGTTCRARLACNEDAATGVLLTALYWGNLRLRKCGRPRGADSVCLYRALR